MSYRFLFVLYQVSLMWFSEATPVRLLRSPCPDIFTYEKFRPGRYKDWIFSDENYRWRGIVKVTPSLPIFLKLKLLVPAPLLSKYVGRIELAESKNQIVKKIESRNLDKIKYYVYFPDKIPIPDLISIEVNSRFVCSQPMVPFRIKTILMLEHSLVTAGYNITSRIGGAGISSGKKPLTSFIVVGKDSSGKIANSGCGKGMLKNSLDSGGSPSVSIGDWPWMVPLFKKNDLGVQFFCSSTLISYEFVVTAAHCIKFKNFPPLVRSDIIAYVGRFDITNWTEVNVQPRELIDIFVHPDFDSERLHSDLAVLKFTKPIQPAPNVAPACLWEGNDGLSEIVGTKGIVFGWGTDGLGNKITPTPKLAVMPIVSQEECLRSKLDFLYLTTNRTLCAGFRNGTGPCSGDSGGGLLIPRKESGGDVIWFLRGIVSVSLIADSEVICDVHEYTVFTDVAKYRNWIMELLSNN